MNRNHKYFRLLIPALLLSLSATGLASTSWYVDGVHGNDTNTCKSPTTACKTIGHAISLASSGDTIRVAAATYKENLTINISLNVLGAGASTTIIDGRGAARVIYISNNSASVILSEMTIRNGVATHFGGGVYNSGILTINNSTVSGNLVIAFCTSRVCFPGIGGGIFSVGSLTISNSTISGNEATGRCVLSRCTYGEGGGIASNSGRLTINNSTVSGNIARLPGSGGGGIFSGGTLSISNSTISGNIANLGSGINGRATLQNSIVANGGGNCYGPMVSNGYNMSSDNTCNFSNSGDRNNTNPMLGPLQNNGGPTQTMALLPGSPAIDKGNPSGCTDGSGHPLTTDQRGMPRPDKEDTGGCDMGAFEKQTD